LGQLRQWLQGGNMAQIDGSLSLVVAALLAAIIGFVNQYGGTCTVAAVSDAVKRKPGRLIALAEAGLWAFAIGLVLKLAGWTLPPIADVPVTAYTIAGGVLLGLGAWLNKACLFGTLTQLGRRNPNYLFTLMGLYAGFLAHAGLFAVPLPTRPCQPGSGVMFIAALLFVASLLSHAWRFVGTNRHRARPVMQFGNREALVIHAMAFTLMASIAGAWTYGELMSRYVHGAGRPDWMHFLLAVSLLIGALLGGARTAQSETIKPGKAMLCFVGGVMMAAGSALVPGGNDLLILYGAPLLQWHAIAAIAVMLVTMAICILSESVNDASLTAPSP
jgi:hypothetical protein